jgi:alanine racemase
VQTSLVTRSSRDFRRVSLGALIASTHNCAALENALHRDKTAMKTNVTLKLDAGLLREGARACR